MHTSAEPYEETPHHALSCRYPGDHLAVKWVPIPNFPMWTCSLTPQNQELALTHSQSSDNTTNHTKLFFLFFFWNNHAQLWPKPILTVWHEVGQLACFLLLVPGVIDWTLEEKLVFWGHCCHQFWPFLDFRHTTLGLVCCFHYYTYVCGNTNR